MRTRRECLPFAINASSSQDSTDPDQSDGKSARTQLAGTPITFTATFSGGTTPHQFKWWVYDGKGLVGHAELVREQYVDVDAGAGRNKTRVAVWVRNAGSTVDAYDNPAANGSVAFAITS
jgi:hypothetical protein